MNETSERRIESIISAATLLHGAWQSSIRYHIGSIQGYRLGSLVLVVRVAAFRVAAGTRADWYAAADADAPDTPCMAVVDMHGVGEWTVVDGVDALDVEAVAAVDMRWAAVARVVAEASAVGTCAVGTCAAVGAGI